MNRKKIIDDTWWLYYMLCEGCGVGPVGDPLFAADRKEFCIHSKVETTGVADEDGFCNEVSVMCCITQQCQLPPVKGSPMCKIANFPIGSSVGTSVWKADLFKEADIMEKTIWCYYLYCGGCGFNRMDQGLYSAQFKQLCCRGFTNLESPVIDGIACSEVSTTLCIWAECQLPPAKGNPTCACLGWRLNKDAFPGGPAQVEMK